MPIRIMTYNVHSCRGGDGRLRPKRIAAVIRQANPDIVALQELNGLSSVEYISEQLGMRPFFAAAREKLHIAFGNALFSQLPAELVKQAPLPQLGIQSEARCAQRVRFETAWGLVDVINTHLGLVREERAMQIEALLGDYWLSAPDLCKFSVLCGDLNALPGSAEFRKLWPRLSDTQHALGRKKPTFPAILPVWRIDHVLVSPALDVTRVSVPSDLRARLASDHRPLIVDLVPKEEP